MDPGRALQLEDLAKENLEKNKSMVDASTAKMVRKESASYYIRQQASDYTYAGQQRPQQIFDPLAWARFLVMYQHVVDFQSWTLRIRASEAVRSSRHQISKLHFTKSRLTRIRDCSTFSKT